MPNPMTLEEVSNVALATKGERFSHRRWPQEVIKTFAVAEVSNSRAQRTDVSRRMSFDRLRIFLNLFKPSA